MNGFTNILNNIVNTIIFWDNLENITLYIVIACAVGLFVLYKILKKAELSNKSRHY